MASFAQRHTLNRRRDGTTNETVEPVVVELLGTNLPAFTLVAGCVVRLFFFRWRVPSVNQPGDVLEEVDPLAVADADARVLAVFVHLPGVDDRTQWC